MELIIILSLLAAAWIVSGLAADGYAIRKYKNIQMDYELYKHIRTVIDYSYDIERDHYIEEYGEESNNYLYLDSDLDLHLEQEDNTHIFRSLNYLANRLSPADQYRLWRRNNTG